jgi:hypothetical protein
MGTSAMSRPDLCHAVEELCVSGEIDPAPSRDRIAQSERSDLEEGQPEAFVFRIGRADRQSSDLDLLHLGHPPEPALPEQTTTSAWHDQPHPRAEPLE